MHSVAASKYKEMKIQNVLHFFQEDYSNNFFQTIEFVGVFRNSMFLRAWQGIPMCTTDSIINSYHERNISNGVRK